MMDEKALMIFEKYELGLFFKLKAGERIYPATIKKIRRDIQQSGLSRESANAFLRDRLNDMCEQIATS